MAAPTRADIRGRARIRADQVESGKPTDAQYNLFIDECVKEVHGDLIMAGYPAAFTTQTIVAVDGAGTYAINSGNPVVSVVWVAQLVGGQYFECKRLPQDRVAAIRSQPGIPGQAGYYDLRQSFTAGPVIEFLPRPTSGTFRVDYIPTLDGLAADGTVWYGPPGSDELIVLCTAAKALRNEGETQDAAALDDEYKQLFVKVMNRASNLDGRNAPVIRDVEGARVYDAFDYQVDGRGY